MASFLKYVRGVIRSLIDTDSQRAEVKATHQPIRDCGLGGDLGEADPGEANCGVNVAAPMPDASEAAELDDIYIQFFTRLRERSPRRLQSTINKWEETVADARRIPVVKARKHSVELRRLAEEIMQEIL